MNEKKVVILLATYRAQAFLPALLDSLLGQTYRNFTVVVSDDGSQDDTLRILAEYASHDERIRILPHEQKFGSAQGNFMYLLRTAPTADYYMFCDHDDVWLPEKVERAVALAETEASSLPLLVHTDLTVTDETLNVLAPSLFDRQKLSRSQTTAQTLIQNNVTGCTVLFNESLRRLAMQKTDTEDMIMHDHFLAILACACGKVLFDNTPTILYRQHAHNQVGAVNASSFNYLFRRFFKAKQSKRALRDTMAQAAMIASLYGPALGKSLSLISQYGALPQKSKLYRIRFCLKNKIMKNTFLRKTGQIFYL